MNNPAQGAVTVEELCYQGNKWRRKEKNCKEPRAYLLLGECPLVWISSILEPVGTDLKVKVDRIRRY